MGTEITKSKISQELYDQGFANEELEIDSDIFYRASTAIDELNQRLIDQTASGMERGKKDQEEIRKLNRDLIITKNALRNLLFAAENADETGYVDGHGFVNLENIYETAHSILGPQKEGA